MSLPRSPETFTNLSLVQIGIALVPTAFLKVVQFPETVLSRFIGLALEHLKCASDLARKNASVFFGSALLQPAILRVFDKAEGLKKLLAAIKASRYLLSQASRQEPSRQEKQAGFWNTKYCMPSPYVMNSVFPPVQHV